jgi:hypothetical protein
MFTYSMVSLTLLGHSTFVQCLTQLIASLLPIPNAFTLLRRHLGCYSSAKTLKTLLLPYLPAVLLLRHHKTRLVMNQSLTVSSQV